MGFSPDRAMRVLGLLSSLRERTAACLGRVFGPASAAAPDSAPEAAAAVEPIVDDVERSVDAAFRAVAAPDGSTAPGTARWDGDHDAARELFASLAANHTQPVRSFIFELRRGSASADWIDVCRPVMGSIAEGAGLLGLEALARSIDEFNHELARAKVGGDGAIDDASRSALLACYERLVEGLPAAFTLGEEDRRREGVILHALLRQIPEVGHVTLERLYGAGLTSLDALQLATRDDLAAATGIAEWLCERICATVQEHCGQLTGDSAGAVPLDPRARMAELVGELRRLQDEFRRIAREDEITPRLAAEKRECLRARKACVLRIDLLLAELGQVELVDELRRLAVERRLERLAGWLAGATPAAAALHAGSAGSSHQPGR